MATRNQYVAIGGNGFTHINDFRVDRIANSNVSTKTLATKSTQIARNLNALSKILETMPTELFDLIGADILNFAEQINNINGEICIAHDKKAGF
jgi:hypothetical protein